MDNTINENALRSMNENFDKKRRRRTTARELAILEEEFIKNPLPSAGKRLEIAERVGMSTRNVQVWYQNKRQTEKKKQCSNNENIPITFVETNFETKSLMEVKSNNIKRTTNYFKSSAKPVRRNSIRRVNDDKFERSSSKSPIQSLMMKSPTIDSPSNQSTHSNQDNQNNISNNNMNNKIKPTGRPSLNLSSILCSPKKTNALNENSIALSPIKNLSSKNVTKLPTKDSISLINNSISPIKKSTTTNMLMKPSEIELAETLIGLNRRSNE